MIEIAGGILVAIVILVVALMNLRTIILGVMMIVPVAMGAGIGAIVAGVNGAIIGGLIALR